MWICIAPRRDHTSKVLRYGMRSPGISQFYLHTPCTCANWMNHTCLPSRSWYSFTDPGGIEGWVGPYTTGTTTTTEIVASTRLQLRQLTQEIGRCISNITEDNSEITFLFQRLSMALRNVVSFQKTMITEWSIITAFYTWLDFNNIHAYKISVGRTKIMTRSWLMDVYRSV